MSEPPPSRAGRKPKYMTPEIRDLLLIAPNSWMVLPYHTANAASSVSSWCKRHPDYECTTRVAKGVADRIDIFVRFTGAE